MKSLLKSIIVILIGAIAAAIPFSCFYFAWSWCMTQVPMAYAWAGLAKIGITLAMVLVGGGVTVALAIIGGTLAVAIAAALLE